MGQVGKVNVCIWGGAFCAPCAACSGPALRMVLLLTLFCLLQIAVFEEGNDRRFEAGEGQGVSDLGAPPS